MVAAIEAVSVESGGVEAKIVALELRAEAASDPLEKKALHDEKLRLLDDKLALRAKDLKLRDEKQFLRQQAADAERTAGTWFMSQGSL